MRLAPVFRRVLPSSVTEEIQAWMVVIGVCGVFVAPFLPLTIGVVVINVVSMLALAVAGLAGLDSARNP